MGRRRPATIPRAPVEPVGTLMLATMHGFGNRIRSMASAWWLAAEVRRELHVVWHADASCGASLEDLFDVQLQSGDILRVNSSTAASALPPCAGDGNIDDDGTAEVPTAAATITCYEPYGTRSVLYASDLARLPYDSARTVHLVGACAVPATLNDAANTPSTERSAAARGRSDWDGSNVKARRAWEFQHRVEGKLRGAFYRALVPSVAVRRVMVPVLACVQAERAAAEEAGQALVVVGVHVRQGDALDKVEGFFNYEPSAHDDAYVNLFSDEMARTAAANEAQGKRTLFFVASDQRRARRQLREAMALLGKASIAEVSQQVSQQVSQEVSQGDEAALAPIAVDDDTSAEGRVSRDCRAVQLAVAEWMLLAREADLIIRSRRSSFSAEASLARGVRCIDI